MRIKDPINFGLWDFYIGEEGVEDSELLRLPTNGYLQSKRALIGIVSATFASFAAQGKPEYQDAAIEEAKLMNIPYNEYIGKLIEHQLCIRHGGLSGGKCYPSGMGDKLHSYAKKLDTVVDKAPNLIQKIYEKGVSLVTKQKTTIQDGKIVRTGGPPRLGGCSSCGGRKAFSEKGKNMGRAGRMQ